MARTAVLAALSLLVLPAGDAIAAKPQPPGTTTPEVAYVKISGGSRRFYELKMSNEDGTGASTVFSSRDVGQMMVDLGPRADRTLLLVQGGRLSLMTYDITSTGPKMTSLQQIIDMGHAGAATAAMSPTGDDVAFIKNGERTVWRYNLASMTFTKLVDGVGILEGVDFSPDGQTVYYLEEAAPEELVLKAVPLGGGSSVELGARGFFTDIAVAANGDLLLANITDWPVNRLYLYTPGGGAPEYLTDGYQPSFKCDGSMVIFQDLNSDGTAAIRKYDMQTGVRSTFSSKDLYWPDYMPTC